MKRSVRIVVLFGLLAMLLISCQGKEFSGEPDLHGYIIEKAADRILVISKEAQDFSDTGGIDQFYDAIFLRNAPKDVEVGQEVRVWIDGPVEESYPAGGTVGKLEVVPIAEPEGAQLKTYQAVQKALAQAPEDWVAITNVTFQAETKTWLVTYASIYAFEDEEKTPRTIEIQDELE